MRPLLRPSNPLASKLHLLFFFLDHQRDLAFLDSHCLSGGLVLVPGLAPSPQMLRLSLSMIIILDLVKVSLPHDPSIFLTGG